MIQDLSGPTNGLIILSSVSLAITQFFYQDLKARSGEGRTTLEAIFDSIPSAMKEPMRQQLDIIMSNLTIGSLRPQMAWLFGVTATNLEPGAHTIFEEASPTFKTRFMWMSNFTDEAAFDEFRKTISWEGSAEAIKVPYLAVAGESDELSPLRYTEKMFKAMTCPRQLVIYQDCRHALGGVPSVTLGPHPQGFVANWMAARLAGKPLTSERWYVDATGRIAKTPM